MFENIDRDHPVDDERNIIISSSIMSMLDAQQSLTTA